MRGPIAVCVHGMTTPSYVWHGLAEGMVKMGYRVLVYDLYGRGYSDRPGGLQDDAFFLRQLDDLLDDQNVETDITLLGYSMGGAIAAAFASAQPGRIRQLVLLAPAGMETSAGSMARFIANTPFVGDWLMLALFGKVHRQGTEAERYLPNSVDNIVDRQQSELAFRGFVPGCLSSLRGILSHDMEAEHRKLHHSGIPVLAIWGRDDDVIPLTASGKLAEWNRTARQEVIDGAGHGLPYTHTDAVLESMRETLRDGLS